MCVCVCVCIDLLFIDVCCQDRLLFLIGCFKKYVGL